MQALIPGLAVGLVLVLAGVALLRWHRDAWRAHQRDEQLDEFDRRHYFAQYRRRTQTSGLLVLLGLLIPAGDIVFSLRPVPLVFTIYWIAVLVLTLWLIVLGVGDMAATRAHAQVALGKLDHEREKLKRELETYRQERAGSAASSLPDEAGDVDDSP